MSLFSFFLPREGDARPSPGSEVTLGRVNALPWVGDARARRGGARIRRTVTVGRPEALHRRARGGARYVAAVDGVRDEEGHRCEGGTTRLPAMDLARRSEGSSVTRSRIPLRRRQGLVSSRPGRDSRLGVLNGVDRCRSRRSLGARRPRRWPLRSRPRRRPRSPLHRFRPRRCTATRCSSRSREAANTLSARCKRPLPSSSPTSKHAP
jgi:hypothetical protein